MKSAKLSPPEATRTGVCPAFKVGSPTSWMASAAGPERLVIIKALMQGSLAGWIRFRVYPVERKTPSFKFKGDISDLAGSLLLVNILFEDADWSSTTRSCEVGRRPQSALPIPLHQIGPFLSEHSAGHGFQRVD